MNISFDDDNEDVKDEVDSPIVSINEKKKKTFHKQVKYEMKDIKEKNVEKKKKLKRKKVDSPKKEKKRKKQKKEKLSLPSKILIPLKLTKNMCLKIYYLIQMTNLLTARHN